MPRSDTGGTTTRTALVAVAALSAKSRACAVTVISVPAGVSSATRWLAWKGAAVCTALTALSNANSTRATPPASVTAAETSRAPPAVTSAGASSVTTGAVVSALEATDTLPVASPMLPAPSKARAVTTSAFPGAVPGATVVVASYGASVSVPISEVPSRKTTRATPTASSARADTRSVAPGAVSAGACSVTCGGSLSGCTDTVVVADAVPSLPAASRAMAVTVTAVPGVATGGTVTANWYGALASLAPGMPGNPAATKSTRATPTLSDVVATKLTASPGSAVAGPASVTNGSCRSAAAFTVTARVATALAPSVSRTVSVTVYAPGASNVNDATAPAEGVPLPIDHSNARLPPSGSVDADPSKASATPTSPFGGPPMIATGGRFVTGLGATATCRDAVAASPRASVTVSVTSKVPGDVHDVATWLPVAFVPSPNVQADVSGTSPSGSLDPEASNATAWPTCACRVEAVNDGSGARFGDGCAVIVTVRVVLAEPPRPSLTTSVTVNAPVDV